MSPLRVRYQTIEFGDTDIHIRSLRDRQEFSDTDGAAARLGICSASWPIFGLLWDSGRVLAELMFDYEIDGKRILEVGCGIALSSLVLNTRQADITATDHHPEAGAFLQANARLNQHNSIPFVRTGWADANSGLGVFDLIIGSDLLYEQDHIELLSTFIDQHADKHCEVIIVDPGRAQHARFSKRMVGLGYAHSQYKPDEAAYLDQPFRGQVMNYRR